ncbi:MAG: hypothetical protein CVU11_13315 [Bacteroidetes bacterium HGW-Bacteroidetes-6]|jgi:hypothetical protein|nr:MAG: hypothetical protein CVU11_13315 [Bacteroidetes bacterium HGW-Bacteroidetes-6]
MEESVRFLKKIEKIRSQIFRLHRENLSLDIFLDKVHGAPLEEYEKASNQYNKNIEEEKKLEIELEYLIQELKLNYPAMYNKWIDIHLSICKKIIDSSPGDNFNSTRRFVAEESIEEWQKVKNGEIAFHIPNAYYLSDYDRFCDQIFASSFSEPGTTENPTKQE